jgi:hypothetical protein
MFSAQTNFNDASLIAGAGGLDFISNNSGSSYYVFFILNIKKDSKPTAGAAVSTQWCDTSGNSADCNVGAGTKGPNVMISIMANSNVLSVVSANKLKGV